MLTAYCPQPFHPERLKAFPHAGPLLPSFNSLFRLHAAAHASRVTNDAAAACVTRATPISAISSVSLRSRCQCARARHRSSILHSQRQPNAGNRLCCCRSLAFHSLAALHLLLHVNTDSTFRSSPQCQHNRAQHLVPSVYSSVRQQCASHQCRSRVRRFCYIYITWQMDDIAELG